MVAGSSPRGFEARRDRKGRRRDGTWRFVIVANAVRGHVRVISRHWSPEQAARAAVSAKKGLRWGRCGRVWIEVRDGRGAKVARDQKVSMRRGGWRDLAHKLERAARPMKGAPE